MGLNNREVKELEKLQKKSGFTKLSVAEQRRLERLEGINSSNKQAVEKQKWNADRKDRKMNIIPKSEAQALIIFDILHILSFTFDQP